MMSWTWLLLGATWFLGSTLLAILVGSAIRSADAKELGESSDHARRARAGRASCRRCGHPRFCHTSYRPRTYCSLCDNASHDRVIGPCSGTWS
jgi:hypothetical protein